MTAAKTMGCLTWLVFGGVLAGWLTTASGAELPARALAVVPADEQRSIIYEADGYGALGENTTRAQAREVAFTEAKRRVLEKAETRISSETLVKNLVLEYDVVIAKAQGTVTILEEKDYGIVDDRYHVWIKAEVRFSLPAKKSERLDSGVLMHPDAPLTVRIWTDKDVYVGGEEIQVFIQGNRDFYARVVNINAHGDIVQLLPNDYRTSNRFRGGQAYQIPHPEDRFTLRVMAPYGQDKMVVYASEAPMDDIATRAIGGGLQQYLGNQTELGRDSRRAVGVEARVQMASQGVAFYEATAVFTTQP
jgi:hypothetical protein